MGIRQSMAKLPEFEIARKRISQQQQSKQTETEDALTRRFARIGGLNSGSYIKTQQIANEQLSKERDSAYQDLDLAEIAEKRRIEEQDINRQFASQEAEKGRVFARGERESSQQFASGERAAQQKFASGEREAGQSFQRELTDKDLAFRDKLFQFDKESKLKQMDMAQKEFDADQRTTEFNKFISILGLNNHGQMVSGMRSILDDQYASAGAKEAAKQYLGGLNSVYLTPQQVQAINGAPAGRQKDKVYQDAVAENKRRGLI